MADKESKPITEQPGKIAQPGADEPTGAPRASVAQPPSYASNVVQPMPTPMMMQQQQQQQQTTVIVNAPKPRRRGLQRWSTGLCGCFEDCSSCCYAFCCYSCFLTSLAHKMNECYLGPVCCSVNTFCGFLNSPCLPLYPNLFLVAMRAKLRGQHRIEGGICTDIICTCCCEFCVVTQMSRELKYQDEMRDLED